jgi:hypothetical protein
MNVQTYRLVIGPDGKVKIPDGERGRTVTVVVEEPSRSVPSDPPKPVAATTGDERERLKEEFLERGRRSLARLKGRLPLGQESEL